MRSLSFSFGLALIAILVFTTAGAAEVKMKKYESWTRACVMEGKKLKRCQLVQKLVDKKGRKIVLFTIAENKEGVFLEVSAPLGLFIPAGIKIKIDKKKERELQLVDCMKNGCRAVMVLDKASVKEFQGGKSISALFVDSKSGKSLSIAGSLKGISAALKGIGL